MMELVAEQVRRRQVSKVAAKVLRRAGHRQVVAARRHDRRQEQLQGDRTTKEVS